MTSIFHHPQLITPVQIQLRYSHYLGTNSICTKQRRYSRYLTAVIAAIWQCWDRYKI